MSTDTCIAPVSWPPPRGRTDARSRNRTGSRGGHVDRKVNGFVKDLRLHPVGTERQVRSKAGALNARCGNAPTVCVPLAPHERLRSQSAQVSDPHHSLLRPVTLLAHNSDFDPCAVGGLVGPDARRKRPVPRSVQGARRDRSCQLGCRSGHDLHRAPTRPCPRRTVWATSPSRDRDSGRLGTSGPYDSRRTSGHKGRRARLWRSSRRTGSVPSPPRAPRFG
jgi:hypothetical protein